MLTFHICRLMPAQLIITAGAQLYMQNNSELTLESLDLVNNGEFIAGNSTVFFTGSPLSNISGASPLSFYNLSLNKAPNAILRLQRNISITQNIRFITGLIDLNAFDIDLGTTGLLIGESEANRVIGPNGGQVLRSAILNAPAGVNPGNLGASFTSTRNLGTVLIRRGHQQQNNVSGSTPSILRYYDIIPEKDAGSRTTLRLYYFDEELNGNSEANLMFYKQGRRNWANMGYNRRNAVLNYVEKDNISSFSKWTLANDNGEGDVLTQTGINHITEKDVADLDIKNRIAVFPNPVKEKLLVELKTTAQSHAIIQVFDSKGALVRTQQSGLVKGNNRMIVDMSGLASGVYNMVIQWNARENKKSILVIKL